MHVDNYEPGFDPMVDAVVKKHYGSLPPVPKNYGMFDVVISNRSLAVKFV